MTTPTPTPSDIASLLTTSVVLSRHSLESDGAGGSKEVTLIEITTVGHLQPRRPRERFGAQQVEIEYDHVLYLGPDADVKRGDRFHLAAAPDVEYRVVEVQDPSYQGHHLQALALREQD